MNGGRDIESFAQLPCWALNQIIPIPGYFWYEILVAFYFFLETLPWFDVFDQRQGAEKGPVPSQSCTSRAAPGHGDCFNLCTATYELHMFTHCYMENRTCLTCVSRGSDPAGCTISSCLLTWHMWGLWSMFAEGSWNFTVAFGGTRSEF